LFTLAIQLNNKRYKTLNIKTLGKIFALFIIICSATLLAFYEAYVVIYTIKLYNIASLEWITLLQMFALLMLISLIWHRTVYSEAKTESFNSMIGEAIGKLFSMTFVITFVWGLLWLTHKIFA